jgi:alpha-mannosidase
VRRIDIHTSVENVAKDHRLRVTFPLPYTVEDAAAEGTFEVRIRPIAAPRSADVADWLEQPVNTFPQKRFVDASNGTIGLGVLNRGLPEYEIIHVDADEPNHPDTADEREDPAIRRGRFIAPTADLSARMSIAVTLLRCVEWLSRGDLPTRLGHAGPMEFTPEAQCLGHHEFDYALVPHGGDWEAEEALVLREAQAFNTPVRVLVTEPHAGQLPSRASLLEVEPRTLVVSAIKQSQTGQGVIVRIYNPLSHPVEATIQPGFACTTAFVAKLNEEVIAEHPQGLPLHLKVRSGEIATILFE